MAAPAERVGISIYWKGNYSVQGGDIVALSLHGKMQSIVKAKITQNISSTSQQRLPLQVSKQGISGKPLSTMSITIDAAKSLSLSAVILRPYENTTLATLLPNNQFEPGQTIGQDLLPVTMPSLNNFEFEAGKHYKISVENREGDLVGICKETRKKALVVSQDEEKEVAAPPQKSEHAAFEDVLAGFNNMARAAAGQQQDPSLDALDINALLEKLKDVEQRLEAARIAFDTACNFGTQQEIFGRLIEKQTIMQELGSIRTALAKKGRPQPEIMQARNIPFYQQNEPLIREIRDLFLNESPH
jgi:hypothetical protein